MFHGMFHGGVSSSALNPTELIHSITLVTLEVLLIMAIKTKCFKVIERKQNRRICYVIKADVFLVMYEPSRPDNSFCFATFAQATNT
jgi:hypothetical protein